MSHYITLEVPRPGVHRAVVMNAANSSILHIVEGPSKHEVLDRVEADGYPYVGYCHEVVCQAFQTGRQYTAQGQRIGYAVISTTREPDYQHLSTSQVAFNDVDRMISGIVAVMHISGDAPSKERVLQCYDAGGYKDLYDRELEEQLAKVARAL